MPRAPKPHLVVINRWRESYARYAAYVDHGTHHVSYITTEVGLPSVPETAADVVRNAFAVHGALDILVLNAGGGKGGRIEDFPLETIDQVLAPPG